jgi:hypothetical protein
MADVLRERGKLGPYTTVGRAASAAVRAWAQANDVECPPRGPVPQAVLDAYRKAH